jgi:hypothetical protein
MSHLVIKFPTRNRPLLFRTNLEKYISLLSSNHQASFIISMDTDDETMNNDEMRDWLFEISTKIDLKFNFGDSKSKVEAINADMVGVTGDVLLLASDDMTPISFGYDDIIFQAFAKCWPQFEGAIKFWDGAREINDPLMTLAILGFPLYRRFGYIYHPSYKSLYCDNEQTEVCLALNRMAVANFCIIRHERNFTDELYLRNDDSRIMQADYENYHHRKSNSFFIREISSNN